MKVWQINWIDPEIDDVDSCGLFNNLEDAKKECEVGLLDDSDSRIVWHKINNNVWHGNVFYDDEDGKTVQPNREYFEIVNKEIK